MVSYRNIAGLQNIHGSLDVVDDAYSFFPVLSTMLTTADNKPTMSETTS